MIFEDKKNWLKADVIKNGETITILDKGEWVTSAKFTNAKTGEPKKDFVCKVDYNGQTFDLTINTTRLNVLKAAYGKDSEQWVGKKCAVDQANVMVGTSMKKTIVLKPIGGKSADYEA